jgi:hypothetical protein
MFEAFVWGVRLSIMFVGALSDCASGIRGCIRGGAKDARSVMRCAGRGWNWKLGQRVVI